MLLSFSGSDFFWLRAVPMRHASSERPINKIAQDQKHDPLA
jgi:hypothetical protein